MAANSAFIFAGLSGSPTPNELMWIADAGAVLPTDSTTALAATFQSLGLVTTDGQSTSTAISQNDLPSFGTYSPSRTIITSEIITVHFTAQETNKVTAAIKQRKALTAVTATAGVGAAPGTMTQTRGPARDSLYSLVVDALDGANHVRKVYPSVRLTSLGDQQTAFAAALQYDFTFTAYVDASGNSEYEYDALVGLA